MISNHYKKKRYKREKFIDKYCNGDGKVIDSFIVDRGHPDGLEKHELTNTGLIIISNVNTQKLVTKLVARPGQIKRYYRDIGREPPDFLLQLAEWHQVLGYNK